MARLLCIVLMLQIGLVDSGRGQQNDQNQAEQRARELVQLLSPTFVRVLTDQAIQAMTAFGKEGLEAQLKRELSAAELDKLTSASSRTVSEVLPQKLWEDAVVPIYTQSFTAAELEAIVAFYATPLGKKLLAVEPELSAEGTRIGREMMQSHEKELLGRFQQEVSREFGRP